MYQRNYQVPVRSEWSEFSLRSRPPKIRKFQAGLKEDYEEEEKDHFNVTDTRRKTRSSMKYTEPVKKGKQNKEPDSIENDVFTIAMSYAEGRQRMLEKTIANTSLHSNSNGQQEGDNKSTEDVSPEDESSSTSSKSTKYKNMNVNKKHAGTRRNYNELEEGRRSEVNHTATVSESTEEKKSRGSRKFTRKVLVEKKPARFTLKDIIGARKWPNKCGKDEQALESNSGNKVEKNSTVPLTTEEISTAPKSTDEQGDAARIDENDPSKSIFHSLFPFGHLDWMDQLNFEEDSSMLALLEAPMGDAHLNGDARLNGDGRLNCDGSLKDDGHMNDADHECDNDSRSKGASGGGDEADVNKIFDRQNMLKSSNTDHDVTEKVWLIGSIVWGRIGKTRWWPAIVIEGPLAGQKRARTGRIWLMWFGDHKITEMRLSQVVNFAHEFRSHSRGRLSSGVEAAIVEALQECANRSGLCLESYAEVKQWGFLEMEFLDIVAAAGRDVDPFPPKTGCELPTLILVELKKLRQAAEGSDYMSDDMSTVKDYQAKYVDFLNNDNYEHFETEVLKEVDFCLSCAKRDRKIVCEHPLFTGYVCRKCKKSLMESLFALDEDGCNMYCVVCGEGGDLYLCDNSDCGRSFCVKCTRRYLSDDALKYISSDLPWICLLCTEYTTESHGVLVPQDNWSDNLIKFFNPDSDQMSPTCNSDFTGRKLRVLSLFDGIGCVYETLQQLNLDIDAYFTIEDDLRAQQIASLNHGYSIVHLGDFDSLTRRKLEDICPIDLVVACPPSDDLDVADKQQEGFNGSGFLMLQTHSVIQKIENICKGNNSVYWLVFSPATMKSEYKEKLSTLFEREPCMWDAQTFSPYISPKLYWGNLPNLYSALEYHRGQNVHDTTLDSFLLPNLNRTALVKKLRNCAIDFPLKYNEMDNDEAELSKPFLYEEEMDEEEPKVNKIEAAIESALSDPDKNVMYLLPIMSKSKRTCVKTGETERILGLPNHYTDGHVTLSKRKQLLKNAPSIFVLKHLLSPLTELFVKKE